MVGALRGQYAPREATKALSQSAESLCRPLTKTQIGRTSLLDSSTRDRRYAQQAKQISPISISERLDESVNRKDSLRF
jgi:hypothetical protein